MKSNLRIFHEKKNYHIKIINYLKTYKSKYIWVVLLFVISASTKIVIHLTYAPWWAGDSSGYYFPAVAMHNHNLIGWDGGRTPGYPLVLYFIEIICGGVFGDRMSAAAAKLTTVIQFFSGFLVCFLIHRSMIFFQMNKKISFSVIFFYMIIPDTSIFEVALLPESFSTFFLLLGFILFITGYSKLYGSEDGLLYAIFAGAVAGYSVLVRPNNLIFFIIFVISIFSCHIIVRKRKSIFFDINQEIKFCLGFLIALLFPVAVWVSFNYGNTGSATITPMTSITRSFAAYNLFDKVNYKDRVLGNILDKYYKQSNAGGTVVRDYLWLAMKDIYAHENEMPYKKNPPYNPNVALAGYIGEVSQGLLYDNPSIWLSNGIHNFNDTFNFKMIIPPDQDGVDPQTIDGKSVVYRRYLYNYLFKLEEINNFFLCLSYLSLLLAAMTGLLIFLFRPQLSNPKKTVFLFSMALSTLMSLIAPCFLAAFYPRFSVPFYPFFALSAAVFFGLVEEFFRKKFQKN